ncbi:MAG: hypothetical protein V1889_00660 [archaeon]
MATLDRVIEMQKMGISDEEISIRLQNEGLRPAEINDSLNQAKIKNAISPSGQPTSPGMQESIMPNPAGQTLLAEQQASRRPLTKEIQTQPTYPQNYQQPAPEIYPPQQFQEQPQYDYYQETPQPYPQQEYYAPQQSLDTETISEIAEQVTTEKLNEFKKQIGDVASFKTAIQDKVNDIDDRLKRIERTIDNLQQSIISKISEFGENNAMIHKDLDNLHGTVSKLMNPLIDNINALKKIAK